MKPAPMPPGAPAMRWKGEALRTYTDLMVMRIDRVDSPKEAQRFMKLYRAVSPAADSNIGYLSGYYGRKDGDRIREWFGVEHPIFGKQAPTAREALLAGMVMATSGIEAAKAAFADGTLLPETPGEVQP